MTEIKGIITSVFISIPHSFCPISGKEHRTCDLLSEKFGDEIARDISYYDADVKIFKADIPKSLTNLTRPESKYSRLSNFRRNLSSQLDKAEKVLLLDIHSSPKDALGNKEYELYILDMPIEDDDYFNTNLYNFLKRTVKIHLIRDVNIKNDIITEAIEKHGLDMISMLEINEEISEERMKEIASRISTFICAYTTACSRIL